MTKTGAHKLAVRARAHQERLQAAFMQRRYGAPPLALVRPPAPKKKNPARRQTQRDARLDAMAKLSLTPAYQARHAAFRRAERLEMAEWLRTGKKPKKLSARASALYKAIGRRHAVLPKTNPTTHRKRPKRKAQTMARRSAAQRAATKRMIAGLKRSRSRRGVTVIANPRRRRRSKRRASRNVVVMANPRRRRRRHLMRSNPRRIGRRHRRRNPGGLMDTLKQTFKLGIPAVLAGGTFGLLDSKVLTPNNLSAPVRYGAKVAYAALLGVLFRKNPSLSAATMGGVLGSLGSDLAATMGGGTPAAPTTSAAVKGIGALLREDTAAMGLLVQEMRGMGYDVDNNVSLGRLGAMGSTGVGDDTEHYDDVNLG